MSKKKILFILDSYFPYQSANGACVQAIADELKKTNYDIHILCYGDNNSMMPFREEPYIHTVSAKRQLIGRPCQEIQHPRLARFHSRCRTLLMLPFYPIVYLDLAVRFYKMGRKIDKQKKIDCIISVMRPMESVLAGYLLKIKRKSLKYFIYELDTMTNDDLDTSWRRHLDFLCRWWERRFYRKADCVFHMKGHEKHFMISQYNNFFNKFKTLDIPLLSKKSSLDNTSIADYNTSTCPTIVYAGSLSSVMRSPEMLIKIIEELLEQMNILLLFYSRGDCEQMLIETKSLTNGAVQPRGYVHQDELNNIISNADFLVNIGNASSVYIPGKTFMYMAFGKPIIHLYSCKEDYALNYLRKYPLVLLLNQNDPVADNAKRLNKFILETRGKTISYPDVEKLFYENTPKYTAKTIIEALD